jgi:fluoride exporter
MSAWVWIGVALLGGVGTSGRFLLDKLISLRAGSGFPFGTLAVNASGALLLGLLTGLAVKGEALVLAGTATLGSYTTFSTWMFESQRLAEDTEIAGAFVNILLSLAVGVTAAAVGRAIGVHT